MTTITPDLLLSKFVLQDIEVRLTGRTASKKGVGTKINELVEVTPSDEDNGSWKKWVPLNTLFQIATTKDDRVSG